MIKVCKDNALCVILYCCVTINSDSQFMADCTNIKLMKLTFLYNNIYKMYILYNLDIQKERGLDIFPVSCAHWFETYFYIVYILI